MGCLAGIVETVGCTAAPTPREFEGGSEGRTGSGARGRMERVGKLRRGVSFNCISSKPSVIIPESVTARHVLHLFIR